MLLAAAMTVTCSPLSSDPSFPSADIDVDVFGRDCNYSPSPPPSSSYASSDGDTSDDDSDDEDEHNFRVAPHWQAYRHLFESRGYHLDTCKDVRQFYLRYWETRNIQQSIQSCAGYRSACREGRDDNELCKDEGLVSFFHWSHSTPCSPIGEFVSHRRWPSGRYLRPLISVHIPLRDYGGRRLTMIPFPAHLSHPHSSSRYL